MSPTRSIRRTLAWLTLGAAVSLAGAACEKKSQPSEPPSRPALVVVDAAPFAVSDGGAVIGGTFRMVALTMVDGQRTSVEGDMIRMYEKLLEQQMGADARRVEVQSIEAFMQFEPEEVTAITLIGATFDGKRTVCRAVARGVPQWSGTRLQMPVRIGAEETSKPIPVLTCSANLDAEVTEIRVTDVGIDLVRPEGVAHMVHAELPAP